MYRDLHRYMTTPGNLYARRSRLEHSRLGTRRCGIFLRRHNICENLCRYNSHRRTGCPQHRSEVPYQEDMTCSSNDLPWKRRFLDRQQRKTYSDTGASLPLPSRPILLEVRNRCMRRRNRSMWPCPCHHTRSPGNQWSQHEPWRSCRLGNGR